MAIITSGLFSTVRFDDTTNEIYQVDGNGTEISGTRSVVASDVATLIKNRTTWQTNETTKIASQIANTTGTSLVPLGGIATLAVKTYSARLPVPANFSVVSLSVSAGTAGTGDCTFRILNKGSAISSSMTFTGGSTNYTVVPQNTSSNGPAVVSGTATDNYLQIQVQTVGTVPPKNITFSLRIAG